nr:MAG TPA: Large polyvalent protein associated domain 23 [Bacteriophage sp.]
MGYNDESAADKRKRWEQAIEQGRQKAAEGNRYKQYMEEHFGITAQQRQQAYEASGMDLLRKDLTTLDNDLRTKPLLAQRGRVSGMLSALQKQRAYFQRYADYFTPEELQGFDSELRRHEALLNGTMTAMEKRMTQKPTAAQQPRSITERAQTGAALSAPMGQMTMPIDQTQRRKLGFLTPQEQRAAVQRGAELQKTYGDQYDVELAAGRKQEAEANARKLYERKKAYVEKREAAGWNSPQEKENEYRRLEYYSRRLGTAQAEKMRFERVQKEYGEAKTMENLAAELQEISKQITASQERVEQLTAERSRAEHPGGRREGNQWVSTEADSEKLAALDKEIKNEQRKQRILEGQQKRAAGDYQAVYYYKYTDLQNREDFDEKSQYRTTRKTKDEYRGGLDHLYKDVYYDYINGDPDAQTLVKVQDDNNTKATHEMWKDLPEETVRIFNYLYETEGKDAAYEYLDRTVQREYTWMQSVGYGLAQGTGLASVASAVRTGAASFFGGEGAKKNAIMDYRAFKESAAAAAQQNPVSYYAGSTVGNLGLMAATGGVAGKVVGTAGGALRSRVATGALSFATAQAIRDAGNAATGEITTGKYGKNILVSGIQGAAGNLAQELVSTGIAQRLTEKGLMTPFMDFLRNTTASMTFSTVNQAIGYLAADEKPTTGEVISGLLSSFAFAMIDGGLRTMRTTKAAKQRIESMIDDVKAQYSALTANGERLTKEQAAERVAAVYQYSQDVKAVLDETYLAGQQETVDQMRAALDFISNEAGNWIAQNVKPGTNSAPEAASGGLSGGMLTLPETGTQGQPGMETPTQPQGGGTPEQVQQLHAEIAEAMTAGAEKGELNNGRTESMREGEGRDAGMDPGIQAGGLESGGSRSAINAGGAGDGEQDRAANLRAERINGRIAQFGRLSWDTANSELIDGGDPETYCAVIPEERYDEGMQRAVENARSKGISVTYIAGQLNVKGDDGEYYSADAVTDPRQRKIVAKADSLTFDPEQLVEHEEFHNLVHGRGELVRSIADEIRKNFDEAEYRQTVEQYLRAYRGVVEDDEQIEAETLADAYAGMNRFRNTNTAQYRETVQRAMAEAGNLPQTNENAAAMTRRGVGDDGKTKLSYAGERAKTANVQALRDAQEMEDIGADMESIRKATGWHKGKDGKWRFEIDDSGMRLDRSGERRGIDRSTALREYNRRWNALISKVTTQQQRNILRKYVNAADSGSFDETLYRQLADEFGSAFEDYAAALEAKRESRDYSEGKVLADYLRHDALFAAYPELRDTEIIFEKLEEGENGYYSAQENAIHLSNKLKNAPEDTLLHEIQHAIQAYEGFSGGTSPEYWARKDYESGDSISDRLQRRYDKLMNELSREEQNRYVRYKELDGELERLFLADADSEDGRKYAKLEAEQDKLYEELWPNEWFRKLLDLDRKIGNPSEGYYQMYRNSAGEIEARDSESRRALTAEQRKETAPDYGDEDTVLPENGADYFAMSADEEAGIGEQLQRHRNEIAGMQPVGKVNTRDYAGLSTRMAREKLVGELKKIGYKVERPGFGVIQFDESEINNSLNYKEKSPSAEDARRTGFLLLKDVLKRGIEISGHEDHKGRGHETTTIAAPVEINGERANMAVVVKQTKGNRYKVHRIYTTDGAKFKLPEKANAEMNTAESFTNGSQSLGGRVSTVNSASTDSIRQDTEKSQEGKIKFSLAASEKAGELTVVNNLSEADLREGLNSGAITLLDDDSEGEVSVVYRSGTEVNGTVPIASVQQVILPRSSSLGTFRDLTEMGINAIDYTANDERTREELVNEAIGMAWRPTQADADAAAAKKLNRQRVESIGDADAPRERNVLQGRQEEKIEEMRRSPDQLRQKIGEAVEAYWDRQAELKAEKKRFGTEYGYYKPLWSRSTKLSPMEAVEALESVTGQVWSIQRRKDGTWKAVQQDNLAMAPRYSKAEALKILEENKRTLTGDPVLKTSEGRTEKLAFVGTPAMEKLGIKIDGSVADYEATPEILASARARKQVENSIKKLMRRYNWKNGSAEAKFAWCIANGKVSAQDIPQRMNYRAVNELANLYMSERMLGEDLLTMRKRAIRNGVLNEVMQLFPSERGIAAGTETFRTESLLTMNYRTARRSMLRIFGDKAGEKINRYLFEPVIRNTAEQMRWTNRQFDRMRTFEGTDGKQEKLNKAESKYVHMLLDLEGYREKINRSENKRTLTSAAGNIAKKIAAGEIKKDEDLRAATSDEAREFGLGSEEAEWVAKYAQYLAEQEKAGEKDSGIDTEKCERAREEYRKAFDEYYDAIVDLLVAHGEEPIGKIEFYAPHMTTNDKVNLLNGLLERMGFSENATTLPASIAGRTEDLRPNKRWTPFFQHRMTDKTEYDIVGAFESYISYIGDVIFHIDDIRKLRITESFLRQGVAGDFTGALDAAIQMSRSGDLEEKEAFLADVGQIEGDELLSAEEINQRLDSLIDELIGEQENNTRYSGLVDWLKTYTDILAGKQYSGDRGLEHSVGRVGPGAKILNVMNQAGRIFSISKVASNISTTLNQSAQLPLLTATRSKTAIMRAIGEFTTGKLKDFTLESDFLTGKRGISYINSKLGEKVLSAMFTPAEFTDRVLSTIAARAAYLDAVGGRKGLKPMEHEDAMRFADNYARSLMGDRTKGAKPVAFHAKNPVRQMINRFQIENLNSWEFLLRDVPEEFRKVQREHGKATAIRMLIGVVAQTLLGAFILNRVAEEAYGGTPAPFDLIGLSANFIASGNGLSTNDGIRYLFNQVSKELFDEEVFENVPEPSESFDLGNALSDTAQNISNDIPFVSNLASLAGWGDKTLPLPNVYGKGKNVVEAILESGLLSRDTGLAALEFAAEILPGGNQAQKTGKGLLALTEGGRITGAKDKERLQFATDGNALNAIRQALFGVYSTPEARAFYASGRSGLSVKQTELWKELREEGADGTELYEIMQTIRAIDKRDDLTSQQQGMAKRRLINEADLTDAQKARMYSVMINNSRDEAFGQMMEAGMSWEKIMEAYEKYKELYDDEELSAAEQALEMARWIEKQRYTKQQKQLVREALQYYSIVPAKTEAFDNYVAAGMTAEEATAAVKQAKKNAGDAQVTTEDKVRAILAQNLTEKKIYAALGTILNEKAYEKLTEAYRAGIPCKVFYEFYRMARDATSDRDEDGKEIKGQARKDKITEYINGLNLTSEQKTVLLMTEYPNTDPDKVWWHN